MLISKPVQLDALHPHLLKVVQRAIKTLPFDVLVIETARSAAQQKKNLANGKSQTAHSRHVVANNKCGKACAIDMAPVINGGKVILWKRLDLFQQINKAMMKAAADLKIPVEWGGNWKTFKDMDHWQLPWRTYP
jgi:peptidoglycan L-alanyl-D-glutamate endopeptidase CwlK